MAFVGLLLWENFMKMLFIALAAATSLTPTNMFAQSFVHCVQAALTEEASKNSEILDPNGIDGGIGAGTLASYASYLEARAGNNLPALLTEDSASEACDALDQRQSVYGHQIKVVINTDGETLLIGDQPLTYTAGTFSKLGRMNYLFGLGSKQTHTFTVRSMTDVEQTFVRSLASKYDGETKAMRNSHSDKFFQRLGEAPTQALAFEADFGGGNSNRTDLVYVDEVGVVRAVVLYNQNGTIRPELDQISIFYIAGPSEILQAENSPIGRIDFEALGIEAPK